MNDITPEFLASQGFSPTLVSRFWAKVRKTDGCWLWTGAVSVSNPFGRYGMMLARWDTTAGRSITMRVHIVSWILHHGPIPTGMEVCHNCPGGDNSLCVNPDHLWLGTHKQNMEDMKRKGRANGGTRFGSPGAKLSPEDVIEIRRAWNLSTEDSLARRFRIHPVHLRRVAKNKHWRSV